MTKRQSGRGVDRNTEKPQYQWHYLVVLPAWVLFSFMASILLTSGILWVLDFINLSFEYWFKPSVYQAIISSFIFILSITITIGVPYWLKRQKTTLDDLGLAKLMTWTDIGLAPVTFIAYLLTVATVMGVVVTVFPDFPINEVQDTGFSPFGSRLDSMMAFLTLVVVAPVAEEVLFRGYLYGKLKRYVPVVWAAVATSALFALVHFQWNVALDVFVLSLFLCGLRSLTGSIWASILLHMTKNGVAYFISMSPFILGG